MNTGGKKQNKIEDKVLREKMDLLLGYANSTELIEAIQVLLLRYFRLNSAIFNDKDRTLTCYAFRDGQRSVVDYLSLVLLNLKGEKLKENAVKE